MRRIIEEVSLCALVCYILSFFFLVFQRSGFASCASSFFIDVLVRRIYMFYTMSVSICVLISQSNYNLVIYYYHFTSH